MTRRKTKNGEAVTTDFVNQAIRDAEAGFPDHEFNWVPAPGRPPLSSAGPSRRLQTRIAPELGDRLDKLAEEREVTISEIVREALERYLGEAA